MSIKSLVRVFVSLFLVGGLFGCGDKGGGDPAAMESVTLSISLPKEGLSKPLFAPAPAAVNSIQISVSGVDFATTTRLLVRDTDFTSATNPIVVAITVLTGSNRIFTAMAFASSDGSGTPLYQGSTTNVTVAGGATKVDIALFTPPFALPTITSFNPTSGCTGISVTITGTSFDPIAQNNTVVFIGSQPVSDDRNATVILATPTSLTVIVPSRAVTGQIVVSNLLGASSSSTPFTVSDCSPAALLFGSRLNLSKNAENSTSPKIATSGTSTVLVTWTDSTPVNSDTFLARSTDGGATFSTPVNLSNNAGISSDSQIAISGSTVLVTWRDNTPGLYEIFVARSADGGATFSTPVNLSINSGGSHYPQIAISGATVLVTWHAYASGGNDIFVARSADGGETFSAPVNLSNNAGASYYPQIAISGATVLVTWSDGTPGNWDIFVARSADGGATFSTPVNLSNSASSSDSPQIAISGATVLVTWPDYTPAGNRDTFVARSTDGGATFSAPVNLSNNTGYSSPPQIAIFGSTVLVTWGDDTPRNPDIFMARSTDGGATFSTPANLANNAGGSFLGHIAVSGSAVLVTWQDLTPGNYDIFMARSTDGGATFSAPVNLSNNGEVSSFPQIATSGSKVLVTWGDVTPGNSDIFMARLE